MKKTLVLVAVLIGINLNAFDFNKAVNSAKDIAGVSNSGDYKSLVNSALNMAVKDLSQNGFLNNSVAKIPLPNSLQTAANLAKKFGGEKLANDLIIAINKSATKAVGGASEVFTQTIKNMSDNDIKSIFTSSENGFTNYLQKNANEKLKSVFKPIIADMMKDNTFANAYNGLNSYVKDSSLLKGETAKTLKNLASNLGASDYLPNSDEDLNDYITRKTLDGLFSLMSQKESQLRSGGIQKGINLLNKIK